MNIDFKIKFSSEKYSWLCFKHAVREANNGKDVQYDIDVFDEYYMGPTSCVVCDEELEEKEKNRQF